MSLWSQASSVAARTPEARNRYVDFLRAVSILAVISGHWLIAAPYVGPEGQLSLPNMLVIRSVMGTKKTVVFVSLVVVMATVSGMIFGHLFV